MKHSKQNRTLLLELWCFLFTGLSLWPSPVLQINHAQNGKNFGEKENNFDQLVFSKKLKTISKLYFGHLYQARSLANPLCPKFKGARLSLVLPFAFVSLAFLSTQSVMIMIVKIVGVKMMRRISMATTIRPPSGHSRPIIHRPIDRAQTCYSSTPWVHYFHIVHCTKYNSERRHAHMCSY